MFSCCFFEKKDVRSSASVEKCESDDKPREDYKDYNRPQQVYLNKSSSNEHHQHHAHRGSRTGIRYHR